MSDSVGTCRIATFFSRPQRQVGIVRFIGIRWMRSSMLTPERPAIYRLLIRCPGRALQGLSRPLVKPCHRNLKLAASILSPNPK